MAVGLGWAEVQEALAGRAAGWVAAGSEGQEVEAAEAREVEAREVAGWGGGVEGLGCARRQASKGGGISSVVRAAAGVDAQCSCTHTY